MLLISSTGFCSLFVSRFVLDVFLGLLFVIVVHETCSSVCSVLGYVGMLDGFEATPSIIIVDLYYLACVARAHRYLIMSQKN